MCWHVFRATNLNLFVCETVRWNKRDGPKAIEADVGICTDLSFSFASTMGRHQEVELMWTSVRLISSAMRYGTGKRRKEWSLQSHIGHKRLRLSSLVPSVLIPFFNKYSKIE